MNRIVLKPGEKISNRRLKDSCPVGESIQVQFGLGLSDLLELGKDCLVDWFEDNYLDGVLASNCTVWIEGGSTAEEEKVGCWYAGQVVLVIEFEPEYVFDDGYKVFSLEKHSLFLTLDPSRNDCTALVEKRTDKGLWYASYSCAIQECVVHHERTAEILELSEEEVEWLESLAADVEESLAHLEE